MFRRKEAPKSQFIRAYFETIKKLIFVRITGLWVNFGLYFWLNFSYGQFYPQTLLQCLMFFFVTCKWRNMVIGTIKLTQVIQLQNVAFSFVLNQLAPVLSAADRIVSII